jgi:hypothetical protein
MSKLCQAQDSLDLNHDLIEILFACRFPDDRFGNWQTQEDVSLIKNMIDYRGWNWKGSGVLVLLGGVQCPDSRVAAALILRRRPWNGPADRPRRLLEGGTENNVR